MNLSDKDLAAFVEWDTVNWGEAVRFWKANTAVSIDGSRSLEIGTNFGGLSIWLASEGSFVTSTDLHGPRPEAVDRYVMSGLSDRIMLGTADVLELGYDESFDIVVIKSVIGLVRDPCTIESQRQAIGQVYKALKPGGELYFAENIAASPLHRIARRACVTWGRSWRYPTIDEMLEFLGPFSHVEYVTLGFAGAFGRTESQRQWLGRVDRSVFTRIVPSSWRYIMAGIARK